MHAYTLVSAVGDLLAAAPSPKPPGPKSIPEVIDGIKLWVMGILAAVATLFLVIGGLRYPDSGPNKIHEPFPTSGGIEDHGLVSVVCRSSI